MRVGMLQLASPDDESIEDRRERVRERALAEARVLDLLVLPELWAGGYFAFDRYDLDAEPFEGPTVEMCTAIAVTTGCWVHSGTFLERHRDGIRNTAVLVGPDGAIAHRYSKVHLFGRDSEEVARLTPGDRIEVVETPFGMFAAATCYDLRFPGIWAELSRLGVEFAVVPAAWPMARSAHWDLLTRARAVENQIVIAACNASGRQRGVRLAGLSRLVLPDGEVAVSAALDEMAVRAEVEPELARAARAAFPVLADRRDDYRSLAVGRVHG